MAPVLCWNCQARVDSKHFCDSCQKIQPTPRHVDFFTFFGLPPRLLLDSKLLNQRFYELSRRFHPDFYQKAAPREREISTEKSSLLNKAYEVLQDPWLRAEYAVSLQGMDPKKETGAVPPQLLSEVLTMQEEWAQYQELEGASPREREKAAGEMEGSLENLKGRLAELEGKLEQVFAEWDQAAEKRPAAEKMVATLHEKNYLETALRHAEKVLGEIRK